MKKIILLSLIFLLCFCTACGYRSNIDERTEKVAEQMISVVDQYLDFEIEAEEAKEKMANLSTRIAEPDDNASSEEKDLHLYATHLENQMRFVSYQIIKHDPEGLADAEDSLLNARNKVAEIIGARKR